MHLARRRGSYAKVYKKKRRSRTPFVENVTLAIMQYPGGRGKKEKTNIHIHTHVSSAVVIKTRLFVSRELFQRKRMKRRENEIKRERNKEGERRMRRRIRGEREKGALFKKRKVAVNPQRDTTRRRSSRVKIRRRRERFPSAPPFPPDRATFSPTADQYPIKRG